VNRNSLRWRVTSFYVGMLAIALIVFSAAVYLGIEAFLMRSLERSLSMSASSVLSDYVKPLDSKGMSWFLSEMEEAYPPGISDTFVRVSRENKILYQTGDMRDPPVSASTLPLAIRSEDFHGVHPVPVKSGQQMILYTLPYQTAHGDLIVIETGATTEPIRHILRSLLLILLIGTPVILVVAAIGGYILMSRPLRPVVTLTQKAETVGRHDLGERLPIIRSGDELERLSLALNRMIDRLEETVAHNRRFSADASHELRTPLTIIRGELEDLMQTLMQTPMLPPSLAEGIGSALEESNRMSSIVESLMTIARLEGGGEHMEMASLDLMSVARVTLDHMSLLAEEKQILFLCEPGEPVYVTGDVMRIKQVIANLLDNGIKYTACGGSVRMSVSAEGDLAVLKVSDTGIGIPANALPLIFERFYRADQMRSRESGGMGLGLSIVKSICGAHHGTVSATSVEGVGTTLRVELPLLTGLSVARDDQQMAAQMVRVIEA
jgi:signal transduction histidine kinase